MHARWKKKDPVNGPTGSEWDWSRHRWGSALWGHYSPLPAWPQQLPAGKALWFSHGNPGKTVRYCCQKSELTFRKKPILWQNSVLSYQCWTDGNDRNAFLVSSSGPKARSQSPRGTRGYKPGGYPQLSPWPWWYSPWPWKAALAECAAQLPRRMNEGPRKMPQGHKHTHSKVSTRSSKMHIRDTSYHLYEKSRMDCFILYFFSFLSNLEYYFDFKKKYWFK